MCLGGDSVGLNHGDKDGDVTQRAALPPGYTHPEGVTDALRGERGRTWRLNGKDLLSMTPERNYDLPWYISDFRPSPGNCT